VWEPHLTAIVPVAAMSIRYGNRFRVRFVMYSGMCPSET
jgi:hypothetical protein